MEPKPTMTPDEIEAHFTLDELFVSRTDERGVIQSGNPVFVRVSGYPLEKLLGSPHNIIRHPDMPKTVFKLFWDTLKSGQPIVAYVKNRSIDGKPYWVLACAFPIDGGFLSIRIKPTSSILGQIKSLYSEIAKEEKIKGIPAAAKLLEQKLAEMGFNTYFDFMSHAAAAEIKARDEGLAANQKQAAPEQKYGETHFLAKEFDEMNRVCVDRAKDFQSLLLKLEEYAGIDSYIGTRISTITQATNRLEALAVNMSISSHRLGSKGATLSVVASTFKTAAKEVLKIVEDLKKQLSPVVEELRPVRLNLMISRLQSEMLAFFTKEIRDFSSKYAVRAIPHLKDIQNDTTILIDQISIYFKKNIEQLDRILVVLDEMRDRLLKGKAALQSLDVIRLGGRLESAFEKSTEEAFGPYVQEMLQFVDVIGKPIMEVLLLVEGSKRFFTLSKNEIRRNLSALLILELRRNRIAYLEPNKEDAA